MIRTAAIFAGCLLTVTVTACTATNQNPHDATTAPEAKHITTADSVDEAPEPKLTAAQKAELMQERIAKQCNEDMEKLKGRDGEAISGVCQEVARLPECTSFHGTPIYHYDRLANRDVGKRILTFALIHGDEGPSGTVARSWMERLSKISPQNSWRVVPVLNPDGWKVNTRVNANKIDINRNFPTQHWNELAHKRWARKKKDPRRYPGEVAASEPETRCAMAHIEDFQPTFIISIHTPYGVLDFDGPRMKFPAFEPLPWFSLGNYPGSLGRYMWKERQVPVLTIELKGGDVADKLEQFDRLQDITGIVAIQSEKVIRKRTRSERDSKKKRARKKTTKSQASKPGRVRKVAENDGKAKAQL